jgi:hypothetical protein
LKISLRAHLLTRTGDCVTAVPVYIAFLWPMVRLVSMLEKRFKNEKAH